MRYILGLLLLIVSSCNKTSDNSLQSIAEKGAKEYLLTNINDPDSYEPIEFSQLDTSLVLGFLLADQVFASNFNSFIKTGKNEYSLTMDIRKEELIVNLVKLLSDQSNNPTFNKAMDSAVLKKKDSPLDFITLFGEIWTEIDPNANLAAIFNTVNLKDKINFASTNQEVLEVIRQEIMNPKFTITHSCRAKNDFGALMVYKYIINFDKTMDVIDAQELPIDDF